MLVRRYKKIVNEGKILLVVAVLFALLVRLYAYFFMQDGLVYESETVGYIWSPIAELLKSNPAISLIVGFLFVGILAGICNYINAKHVLIRTKTQLPAVFILFLFSLSPSLLTMNSGHIAAITLLVSVSSLFTHYNTDNKQAGAFGACFILAVGSLFNVGVLIFLPLLLIALPLMRCLSFKSLLASIFAFVIVYTPVLCFFVFKNQVADFLIPFQTVFSCSDLMDIPLLHFQERYWIVFIIGFLILGTIFFVNHVDSYKDKIKIRAMNRLLAAILIYALLLFLFLNSHETSNRYVILAMSSLVLAHFYALAEVKWKVISFFIYSILFFVVCGLLFFS